MKKIIFVSIALSVICFLSFACKKTKEGGTPVQPQNSATQQSEQQAGAKAKQQLSALERARGKEVVSEEGLPVVTWGSLKDLPTLDDVFPVVDKLPDGVEFPKEEKKPEVKLPETEERKQIKKWLERDAFGDEGHYNHLYAIQSLNGKCVVEFGGYFDDKKQRHDWIRSIDPGTSEVHWKYDEPGLTNPAAEIHFANESDVFILSRLAVDHSYYFEKKILKFPSKVGVKLFSCQSGFIREYMKSKSETSSETWGKMFKDGQRILVKSQRTLAVFEAGNGDKVWSNENLFPNLLDNLYDAIITNDEYRIFALKYIAERKTEPPIRKKYMELYLFDANDGGIKTNIMVPLNFGDPSTVGLIVEKIAMNDDGSVIYLWALNGIEFVHDKTNPYANVLLIVKNNELYAFRLKSLGFSLSKNARYLSANGKNYNLIAF